jgi:PPM family protein phosphatase
MGTTLTCAYTAGLDAVVIHISDSRAYVLREGRIRQITRDHTLAQALVDTGMKVEDTSRLGNTLVNCLGAGGAEPIPDVYHIILQEGDSRLLCTDGLTKLVTDQEIAQALTEHVDPQATCDAILMLAISRGGVDSITIILGQYQVEKEVARSQGGQLS